MKLILDSHNVEVTEAIKAHVSACMHKLEHMNQRALEARVNLERDHVGLPENKLKCTMHIYFKGTDMFAEDHESDLYVAIDLVTKKISSNCGNVTIKSSRDITPEQQRPNGQGNWLTCN